MKSPAMAAYPIYTIGAALIAWGVNSLVCRQGWVGVNVYTIFNGVWCILLAFRLAWSDR